MSPIDVIFDCFLAAGQNPHHFALHFAQRRHHGRELEETRLPRANPGKGRMHHPKHVQTRRRHFSRSKEEKSDVEQEGPIRLRQISTVPIRPRRQGCHGGKTQTQSLFYDLQCKFM